MNIIKEYCDEVHKYVIRTNTYGHTWEYFNTLVNEAKKDYPTLNENEVEIVQYAGEHYKRTYGIEFRVEDEPKDEYFRIRKLEYTF